MQQPINLPAINLSIYLFEGIRAGLLLAFLVGPLMVLLLQLSLRRGTLAAFFAAGGIWLSDLLFVLATHYGIGSLDELISDPSFRMIIGGIGSFILLATAVFTWFRDPPDLDMERELPRKRGLFAAFLQGFAINTFNPFTIGFWTLFTVSQVHDRHLDTSAAWAIYAGILGTIILTDTIKVLAARKVRDFLQPKVIRRVQRLGAIALAVFGVALGLRVWLA
ncbi:LysE family translocator [Neolewinella persica]|uniref:LysE family translocator n=1 Tax=Neolewinella persica TaxID=70998 RepID=UPI0003718862|nr:LysE family transporter [Neolewinella persica]